MGINQLIDAAIKNAIPDMVFKNAKVVNVFSHEIINGDVAVHEGIIVGIGNYNGKENIDCSGKYIVPGLIDAHVHIESSMLSPAEFSKAVLKSGTTTVIADPHEIANVCGLDGIKYILDSTEKVPLNVFVMLPSCVPATDFEHSGAVLNAEELNKFIKHPRVLGLGEMMNYPGIINKDNVVFDKINMTVKNNKIIDGHAPKVTGDGLNAYVLSGISTEHECSEKNELIEKLRTGMYILIREGSAAKDLKNLIGAVNEYNYRRIMFCTDDKHSEDLLRDGHISYNVKLAIKSGINPITAIQMATINAAECYRLNNIGAVAPGYKADIIVIDDLKKFNIEAVYKDGKVVVENDKLLFELKNINNDNVTDTVKLKEIKQQDIQIKLSSTETEAKVNVIQLQPGSIITKKIVRSVKVVNNYFVNDGENDILKLAVIERHHNTGNIGLGLIENFGLKNGAIATTIAHDSHNLIVIGDNDEDMINAANKVIQMHGGIAVSSSKEILESLQLDIGGLMSNKSIDYIDEKIKRLIDILHNKLKVNKDIDPFLTLAFSALPVIPSIKLTDSGLFDVDKFEFIDLQI